MRKLLILALGLTASLLSSADTGAQSLSPELVAQIRALEAEKASRTPAERKISSHLIHADRMRRGLPIARGITRLRSMVEVAPDGSTMVDVRAVDVDALRVSIESLGGDVIHASPQHGELRARLPLSVIRQLADGENVIGVHPAARAFTRKVDASEGDVAHGADQLRGQLSIDGSGVKVGVLSDGVDSLASLQASGDLPGDVSVLPGQAGSGSEGTAMLEIIHDLAPGADLLFATAFISQASFAQNVLALRQAGADVIVDDVGYFAEGVFQDDDVADAVNSVTADGALYFSSAGNSGNFDDGTSGVWEGDFSPSTSPVSSAESAHAFSGGDVFNEITTASPFVYTLHWADPLGSSSHDYDLYMVNKSGRVIFGASTDIQDGDDDPFEIIGAAQNDTGNKLLVVRKSADSVRYIHLNANRGRLEYATAGQTAGHATARDAFGVAAVDVRGTNGAFDGTESVQTYSSDGPRRIFFEADGTEITPGLHESTGGELRQKPDLAAADCVSTATPGFSTFCGTSAAAPHAAAIAALLIDFDPQLTPVDVRAALSSTALDIEAAGVDRNAGSGIVMAPVAGEAIVDCTVDADCDDGTHCNGAESCSLGSCVAGPGDPCSGGPLPFCDEGANACVQCLASADCDDGSFCNGAEGCVGGACLAGAGDPCDGTPAPLCDEGANTCVQCLAPSDCDDALYCNGSEGCIGGACVVGPGDPCSGGSTPFCDETTDLCLQCLDDLDCDDGAFCNGPETCSGGSCVPGAGDPCPLGSEQTCDEVIDLCVQCIGDSDCAGGSWCDGGVCTPPRVPSLRGTHWLLALALAGAVALPALFRKRSRA